MSALGDGAIRWRPGGFSDTITDGTGRTGIVDESTPRNAPLRIVELRRTLSWTPGRQEEADHG